MEIKREPNKISIINEKQGEVAYVFFPQVEEGVVHLQTTYVDASFRGRGIAEQLMTLLCEELRCTHRKAIVSCSYAQHWFLQHPSFQDVLK